jgi:hypothetical protein
MPYVTADRSLPRSLDVQISLSRAQAETRTDLSIMAVALEDLGLLPDSERVRFYSTIEAVENDYAPGTEAHFAASAFFNQTPRAQTLALGEVFLGALPSQLVAGSLSDAHLLLVNAVSDGSMTITYNPDGLTPTAVDLSTLDFSSASTVEAIAAVIDTALSAEAISCSVKILPGDTKRIIIETDVTGTPATIQLPIAFATGTFVGDLLRLTADEGGKTLDGYDVTGIADELASILNAANNIDKYIYGWALGASLRDTAIQTAAAEWALPRTAIMALTTNDLTALDPTFETDMGPVILASGNRRVVPIYHDNVQRYPCVSILAYMLHVNYRLQDSTVTAKFKQLPGIETVQLTETQWATLQSKGYNTYTAIGNSARTYRDGDVADPGWYMDTTINLDNFSEDLSVNVFNVFLRNKKVPYTRRGQMLLMDACTDTGNQYTYNGTFADREVADSNAKSGVRIDAAVLVEPTPIAMATAADRADRMGPPIAITVQEAGAIHSVAINVEVVS